MSKNKIWWRLGRVKTKVLFAQQILGGVLEAGRGGVQWGKVWFDMYFGVFFDCCWLLFFDEFDFCGEAGYWVSTQIWDFPNISLFSKILCLKSFRYP